MGGGAGDAIGFSDSVRYFIKDKVSFWGSGTPVKIVN